MGLQQINTSPFVAAQGQLGQANARIQARSDARKQRRYQTLGMVAGAVVGGAAGGPMGALYGASIGGALGSGNTSGAIQGGIGMMANSQNQEVRTQQLTRQKKTEAADRAALDRAQVLIEGRPAVQGADPRLNEVMPLPGTESRAAVAPNQRGAASALMGAGSQRLQIAGLNMANQQPPRIQTTKDAGGRVRIVGGPQHGEIAFQGVTVPPSPTTVENQRKAALGTERRGALSAFNTALIDNVVPYRSGGAPNQITPTGRALAALTPTQRGFIKGAGKNIAAERKAARVGGGKPPARVGQTNKKQVPGGIQNQVYEKLPGGGFGWVDKGAIVKTPKLKAAKIGDTRSKPLTGGMIQDQEFKSVDGKGAWIDFGSPYRRRAKPDTQKPRTAAIWSTKDKPLGDGKFQRQRLEPQKNGAPKWVDYGQPFERKGFSVEIKNILPGKPIPLGKRVRDKIQNELRGTKTSRSRDRRLLRTMKSANAGFLKFFPRQLANLARFTEKTLGFKPDPKQADWIRKQNRFRKGVGSQFANFLTAASGKTMTPTEIKVMEAAGPNKNDSPTEYADGIEQWILWKDALVRRQELLLREGFTGDVLEASRNNPLDSFRIDVPFEEMDLGELTEAFSIHKAILNQEDKARMIRQRARLMRGR